MIKINRTLIWFVYFDLINGKECAIEMTEDEKKIPIKDVLKKRVGEQAMFITMQIAFNEEEALRKRPRL